LTVQQRTSQVFGIQFGTCFSTRIECTDTKQKLRLHDIVSTPVAVLNQRSVRSHLFIPTTNLAARNVEMGGPPEGNALIQARHLDSILQGDLLQSKQMAVEGLEAEGVPGQLGVCGEGF